MDVATLLVKLGISTDTKPLEKVEQKLEAINGKLRFLAAAEVARALYHLTEGFGHSSLELINTATAAGLTTDAMQRLQYAVTQAGGNAGELGMTMTHLARMVQGAKMGMDDALQTFYLLGISQQQIASFKSTEDVLYGVMDALQKVQDPIRRQALMDRALGQGSRALGNFALAGRKAALASQETARRLHVAIPRSSLDAMAKAHNSMATLGLVFKSVAAQLASGMAPALVSAVRGLTDFYVANRAMISTNISKFIQKVTFGFGQLYAIIYILGRHFSIFIEKHQKLIDLAIEWMPTLIGLALTIPRVIAVVRSLNSGLKVMAALMAIGGLEMLEMTALAAALTLTMIGLGGAASAAFEHFKDGTPWKQTEGYKMLKGYNDDFQKIWETTKLIGGELNSGMTDLFRINEEERAHQELPPEPDTNPDIPRLRGRFQRMYPDATAYDKVQNLLNAQGSAPGVVARPGGGMSYTAGPTQVTNNVTVNTSANVSPDQATTAVRNATREAMARSLEQAMRAQTTPFAH